MTREHVYATLFHWSIFAGLKNNWKKEKIMVRSKFSLGPDILSWKTLLMHKSQWKDDTPNLSSENLNLWNWIWKTEIKNLDKNMKTKLVKQKLEQDFWKANPGQNFELSCEIWRLHQCVNGTAAKKSLAARK